MHKNLLLVCLVSLSSFAMEEEGRDLVISSQNFSKREKQFPFYQLWQKETATIDEEKSKLKYVKEDISDVSLYIFKENIFKSVYIDPLLTKIVREGNDCYLGACIKNIQSGMKKGAQIEIEWYPFIEYAFSEDDPFSIQNTYNEKIMQTDPFTIVADINVVLQSSEMACSKYIAFKDNPTAPFVECVIKLKKINNLLNFYEEQKVGAKDLLQRRLEQEITLLKDVFFVNKKAALLYGPSANLEEFNKAMDYMLVTPANSKHEVKELVTLLIDEQKHDAKIYDVYSFLPKTFFNFIIIDALIEQNIPYVKNFMKNMNFKEVSIERKNSKRTGRKNVWIIKGINS